MPKIRTRTHKLEKKVTLPAEATQAVQDRGFFLYNWISVPELRLSIRSEYLNILSKINTPFLIIAAVGVAIGLTSGIIFPILWALGTFAIMYFFIFLFLFFKAIKKGNLYAKGANITLTDTHFVAGDTILPYTEKPEKSKTVQSLEKEFGEKLFGNSTLDERIERSKQDIKERLGSILEIGVRLSKGQSKETGRIFLVLMIVGGIYALTFGAIYYIGLFLVDFIALGYARILDKILQWRQKTEHQIQSSFESIDTASGILQEESKNAQTYLKEAVDNKWMNSLSKRIDTSFEKINTSASTAIDTHIKLKEILINSKYKDIFSFEKYENWMRGQVVNPIQHTLDLLTKNTNILKNTIQALDLQIQTASSKNHKTPLIAQKTRLEIQLKSTQKTKKSLQTLLDSIS